jgi:hypothetical protein
MPIRNVDGGNVTRSDTATNGVGFNDVPNGASTQLVAANRIRAEITVTNDSDTVVYLSLGVPAELSKGIRLNANGGSWTSSAFTGAIFAFQGGAAAKRVTFAEV